MCAMSTYKHEWHLVTGYCVHCGLSQVHELDPPYPCHRTKNVTAISHKVRNKDVLRTTTDDNNPSPNDTTDK
jgi:hypothetical protein